MKMNMNVVNQTLKKDIEEVKTVIILWIIFEPVPRNTDIHEEEDESNPDVDSNQDSKFNKH